MEGSSRRKEKWGAEQLRVSAAFKKVCVLCGSSPEICTTQRCQLLDTRTEKHKTNKQKQPSHAMLTTQTYRQSYLAVTVGAGGEETCVGNSCAAAQRRPLSTPTTPHTYLPVVNGRVMFSRVRNGA